MFDNIDEYKESIDHVFSLLETQNQVYYDVIEAYINSQKQLTVTNVTDILSISPEDNRIDKIRNSLIELIPRLKQIGIERKERHNTVLSAIEQKKSENEYLKQEIGRLVKIQC